MINWKKKNTSPNISSEALHNTLHGYSINRHNFLAGMITSLIAVTLLIAVTFSPLSFLSTAYAEPPTPKVDVHCHIFNARDIPLVGVLKHFLKDTSLALGTAIALIETSVLPKTPGYVEENEKLNELLLAGPYSCTPLPNVGSTIDNWFNLMKQYRFRIACELVTKYPDIVLFTPAMLDFDHWVPDNEKAETTIAEQVILYEKIVRLLKGKIHPLVAFNPLKEVHYREDIPEYQPLKWVKEAVEERGFIGVKLYPPMGFFPINNTGHITDMLDPSYKYRVKMDEALEDLYDWCIDKDVPIMAHCADSNESQQGYGTRASPEYWEEVLSIPKYSNLRLNLGHFGGEDSVIAQAGDWAWKIAELMEDSTYPNVYADTGYHIAVLPEIPEITPGPFEDILKVILEILIQTNPEWKKKVDYINSLKTLYEDFPKAKFHLMYGSDLHVLMVLEDHEKYVERFDKIIDNTTLKTNFFRKNALRFFGLDGDPSGNRQRLLAFYVKHNMTVPPSWWVGDWWASDIVPPSTPVNLTAAASPCQINLTWVASTDNAIVTGYNIYREDVVEVFATATETTYQDTALDCSTTYTYTVSAFDAAGNVSSQCTSVSATTPP